MTIELSTPGRRIAGAVLDGSRDAFALRHQRWSTSCPAPITSRSRTTGSRAATASGGADDRRSMYPTPIDGGQPLRRPLRRGRDPLSRYHGPDPDPYGILIEGNEITGVREGSHSDRLQSVGGGSLTFAATTSTTAAGGFRQVQPDTVRKSSSGQPLPARRLSPARRAPGLRSMAIILRPDGRARALTQHDLDA